MTLQQVDVIVRAGAAALLLMLAAVLLRDGWRERRVRLFVPLAICLCGFLNGNTPDVSLQVGGQVGALGHLLSGYAAVFLWWFCLAVFDRDFRPRGPVLAAGIAWLIVASLDRGLLGPSLADRGLSWLLVAMGFGIVGHILWSLISDRAGDLVEARRKARVLVGMFLAAQLLADLGVDVAFGLEWRPRVFAIAQNTAVLGFAVWLYSLFVRAPLEIGAAATADLREVKAVQAGSAPLNQAEPEARLAERLRTLIEVKRVHLDPGLTFAGFVAAMGAPERTVRAFINHRLGHEHFRAFLNVHRVAEAKRRLADSGRAGEKLVTIAFDSGFASLASFNRAFRASESCSPRQFRAAARMAQADGNDGASPRPIMPTLEERSAGI